MNKNIKIILSIIIFSQITTELLFPESYLAPAGMAQTPDAFGYGLSQAQIDDIAGRIRDKIGEEYTDWTKVPVSVEYDCTRKKGMCVLDEAASILKIYINPREDINRQLSQIYKYAFVLKELSKDEAQLNVETLFSLLKEVPSDRVWQENDILDIFEEKDHFLLAVIDPTPTPPKNKNIIASCISHIEPASRTMHELMISVNDWYRQLGIGELMWEKTLVLASEKGYFPYSMLHQQAQQCCRSV